jgi:uncharacterized protein YndB with AHSA1/START domain
MHPAPQPDPIAITRAILLRGLASAGLVAALPAPLRAQTVQGSGSDFRMTLATTATRERIYALWSDPAGWSRWDPQVKSVRLAGAVRVGARGKLQGTGGPESDFEITAAEPGVRFAYSVMAPLARIEFTRTFEAGDAVRFTHRVRFAGAGGGALAGILGRRFREGLPPAMTRLNALAEAAR